ncbi:amidohydrolase family protein [Sediminispirochaeta bajacaliforniensis]|uniref:amidohydrolase family protein n=1 Tax=Sediminispirochaeta bajacaliforniensis TaxID=148 RepID=UPI000371FEE2|nr:amidohydrolase family protein [Sediminispirochaeta bajacaliforniensis]
MRKQEEKHRKIDVHAHMIPEFYVKKMKKRGINGPLWNDFPRWSPEKDMKVMRHNGIAKRILSLSIPGVWIEEKGGDIVFAKELARECNEYASQIKKTFPDYYGAFATIPFPNTSGTIEEIKYALDVLKLDGITLFTNTGGRYPGEDEFQAIFSELDARKAVVFIHPEDIPLEYGEYSILAPIIDRLLDTGRSMAHLLTQDVLSSYPNVRYILSHGGGSFPLIIKWMEYYNQIHQEDYQKIKSRLFFDTAQQGNFLYRYLKGFCGTSQIVFGTDGGWQSPVQVAQTVKAFDTSIHFNSADFEAIEWKNVQRLFPNTD